MNGLILDVVVAVVAVLLIIFGVWRGLYKLIFGLVSGIAAIVLAIMLSSVVTSAVIDKTKLDDLVFDALDEKIQEALPEDLHAGEVTIVFYKDGTVNVSYGTGEFATISEYLADKPPFNMVGSLVDSLVANETASKLLLPTDEAEDARNETTLANVLSTVAIVYIMLAVIFILLWILCYILMRFIMYLVKKLVNKTYIGHFVDKLLGMVVGAALALVLVWGVLAVIRLLGTYTWIISVNEIINSSTITKMLFDNNFLYNMLVANTNLQETIAGLIGSLGQS